MDKYSAPEGAFDFGAFGIAEAMPLIRTVNFSASVFSGLNFSEPDFLGMKFLGPDFLHTDFFAREIFFAAGDGAGPVSTRGMT